MSYTYGKHVPSRAEVVIGMAVVTPSAAGVIAASWGFRAGQSQRG